MGLTERYWAKVDVRGENDCWPWTGALNKGYGVIGRGRAGEGNLAAHRVGYEIANGPIPIGYDIDHECHNDSGCKGGECEHRACQNPKHLVAKTRSANLIASPNTVTGRQSRKPECEHGERGHCPECKRSYMRAYDATRRKGGSRERPKRTNKGTDRQADKGD